MMMMIIIGGAVSIGANFFPDCLVQSKEAVLNLDKHGPHEFIKGGSFRLLEAVCADFCLFSVKNAQGHELTHAEVFS